MSVAFDHFWMGLAGFILLPWTTLAWAVVYAPLRGVTGFGWFFVILGLVVDLSTHVGAANARRESARRRSHRLTAPNGFDVVVVGGGLVGAALAYELVTAGARVALVDRHDPGRATDAGAGILSPETMSQADPIWFELAMGAGEHYRDLVPALDSDGIRSTGYAVTGLLRVGFREWEDDLFAANIALARERCPEEVEEITTDEARRRFPPLGDIRNAWYSRAARVDGRSMTTALLEVALTAGLTVIDDTVDSVEKGNGSRVAGVTTAAGRPLSVGAVVIAGGAWTPAVADQLSVSIPVAPVRGQIVHVRLEGADTSSWPIVSPLLSQYILPWPDGRLVVGATVEPDAGFDARVTAAGMRQLFGEMLRLAPGSRTRRSWRSGPDCGR